MALTELEGKKKPTPKDVGLNRCRRNTPKYDLFLDRHSNVCTIHTPSPDFKGVSPYSVDGHGLGGGECKVQNTRLRKGESGGRG